MRTVLLLIAAVLALMGCEREQNPVEQYGTGLVDAYKDSQAAGQEATLGAIRTTIAAYRATEGKYPASLDEIAASMGTTLDPEIYAYDPSTGSVNSSSAK